MFKDDKTKFASMGDTTQLTGLIKRVFRKVKDYDYHLICIYKIRYKFKYLYDLKNIFIVY